MKNPGRVDDDFWCSFLSMWTNGICFMIQFVWFFMPGKQPTYFYICKGKMTEEENKLPSKSRNMMTGLIIISLLINVAILIRIQIYKWKENTSGNKAKRDFDKSFLNDLLHSFFVLGIVITTAFLVFYINNKLQINSEQIPSYKMFWLQHLIGPLGITSAGAAILCRKRKMRQLIIDEIKLALNGHFSP